MKVRATIGLTIDIDREREMGLEIEDDQIDSYAIESLEEYIYEFLKRNELGDIVKVERVSE